MGIRSLKPRHWLLVGPADGLGPNSLGDFVGDLSRGLTVCSIDTFQNVQRLVHPRVVPMTGHIQPAFKCQPFDWVR
ncbi:hypothetical protein M407DRAFT_142742 [Tulasnella calospora MUT 4182]|uniref:Uncharacterized protein n=1 Tax=Tulasnella calospora MUT 4182 TaxID=1051891 RepID=A0A0C3PXU2_9AGAM|nr:hypothetical protein M407DRAFT_142742 [Tulasnella calospora MUT 4182]